MSLRATRSNLVQSVILFSLVTILFLPKSASAGAEPCGVPGAIPMQVYIPFISAEGPKKHSDGRPCYYLKPFTGNTEGKGANMGGEQTPDAGELTDYIAGLYMFGLSIGGLVALIMIMIGGFQWTMAGGNAQGVGKAKERITNAVVGLILLLLSYTILSTINPQLVSLKGIDTGPDITPNPIPRDVLSPEETADFLTTLKMKRDASITKISAQKKTSQDALTASERMLTQAKQAYKDGKPQIIQQLIDGMEQQKAVAAGNVTNIQKEIEKITMQRANTDDATEKTELLQDLNKANDALKTATSVENTIIKSIADSYYLKTCASETGIVNYFSDSGCP